MAKNDDKIIVEGFNKIALQNRIKDLEQTLMEIKELLRIDN